MRLALLQRRGKCGQMLILLIRSRVNVNYSPSRSISTPVSSTPLTKTSPSSSPHDDVKLLVRSIILNESFHKTTASSLNSPHDESKLLVKSMFSNESGYCCFHKIKEYHLYSIYDMGSPGVGSRENLLDIPVIDRQFLQLLVRLDGLEDALGFA